MDGNKSLYAYPLIAIILGLTVAKTIPSTQLLHTLPTITPNPISQEIARINCVIDANVPSLYSRPKDLEVKIVRWNPKSDLLAVWCTNSPNIFIFDTKN